MSNPFSKRPASATNYTQYQPPPSSITPTAAPSKGNVSTPGTNTASDKSATTAAKTTIAIPDVGVDEYSTALKGQISDAQSDVGVRTATANQNLASYEAPDPNKVNTIKDASTYERPEDTVAFQMSTLLNKGSDYMKVAESRARDAAQRYGLSGSSMAIGAAHRAAIESSLPIATQDAKTSATYGQQQQASDNQIGVIGAESEYSGALMTQRVANENIQNSLKTQSDLSAKGIDADTQLFASELTGRWQYVTQDAETRLTFALQTLLDDKKIDADTVKDVRTQASQLVQNHQVAVETMLTDPDFLQLGQATIKNTINNMLRSTTASIQFLAYSSGVNMDEFLDDFEDNATFTTNITPPAVK